LLGLALSATILVIDVYGYRLTSALGLRDKDAGWDVIIALLPFAAICAVVFVALVSLRRFRSRIALVILVIWLLLIAVAAL
jgi:uncharacterized membrane protein YoaK (UPF0700 family)